MYFNEKDKSYDDRQAYYRKILLKEEQIDDLRRERNRTIGMVEEVQGQLNNDYRQLEQLEYNLYVKGSANSQRYLNRLSETRHRFENQMYQVQEDIQSAYQKLSRQLENDMENLHQERNALPWD